LPVPLLHHPGQHPLARQPEGALGDQELGRLDALMRSYRQGMVRKAWALKVAVARGLQPPLS
jgi:hypothetical protein